VIWGWVPALLWVIFGSIFAGAVHDFGALVLSMRHEGKSIGDITGTVVSPRARTLFFIIIFFCLWIVIAIFALLMVNLFVQYPQCVFPIWFEIPIAMGLSYYLYQRKGNLTIGSIIAIVLMYLSIWIGLYIPVALSREIWLIIIMAYIFIASTLPVQRLLQPRDYINALELLVVMVLLIVGIIVRPMPIVAPAVVQAPAGAPAMMPFLFIHDSLWRNIRLPFAGVKWHKFQADSQRAAFASSRIRRNAHGGSTCNPGHYRCMHRRFTGNLAANIRKFRLYSNIAYIR